MDHTLFWADAKLDKIESIRQDGSNRMTVIRGGKQLTTFLYFFIFFKFHA